MVSSEWWVRPTNQSIETPNWQQLEMDWEFRTVAQQEMLGLHCQQEEFSQDLDATAITMENKQHYFLLQPIVTPKVIEADHMFGSVLFMKMMLGVSIPVERK